MISDIAEQVSIEDYVASLPTEKAQELLKQLSNTLAVDRAKERLVSFIRYMMPWEDGPVNAEDGTQSLYQDTPQGALFCEIIEDVERGTRKRTAVAVPPQHGKTIHLSTFGPAWIWGRNPKMKIVVATYNEDRAAELGDDFLQVVKSPLFKQVFPDFELSPSSKSKTAMRTTAGGKLFFVGQGSGTTGKTADIFIIDDPIKDDKQVKSADFRDDLWKWFFSVAYSRGSNRTRMIVLHTRWHEDDLIGRLCDTNHPERNREYAGIADDWNYLNIPGVIKDPELAKLLGLELAVPKNPRVIEQFGDEPMCALWAADKDLLHFSQWRRGDKRSFGALVMGTPTPEEGVFFHADDLLEYDPQDLPQSLRYYGASDHAVSTKQERDPTVLGTVGVDPDGHIWVLPDLVWDRFETDKTVEELIAAFKRHNHETWFMEDELISKSFGPFLRERMRQEYVYTMITPVRPAADKRTRARSIQGRMSLKTVHFPRFAAWWPEAKAELLRFDYGAYDDFVDFLSHIGNGLNSIISADGIEDKNTGNVIQVGSPQWILKRTRLEAERNKRKAANDGW
ncbi:MAG: phage terminase large subunit [Pseudomonadota bacterium]